MPITFADTEPLARPTQKSFEQRVHDLARARAHRTLDLRRRARTDFRAFCEARRNFVFSAWQLDLIEHIEWARNTPNARLMIFAPPRHGKSEIVSRQLPAFLLGEAPQNEVICAAGTQGLADEFGLYVRNALNDPLYQEIFPNSRIDKNSNAISKVTMQAGGGYRSVGCQVQIVGRGAHWLIIDDPYASREDAYSANARNKIEAWYRSEARTRLAPGGRVILMHQRWHPEDLAATLLALQTKDRDADQWRVLVYPAIREAGYTDDFDHYRQLGQELAPDRWSMSSLRAVRAGLPNDEWLALYQQRPVNAEGGFFKADWFQYHSGVPENLNWYIGVDFAATADTRNDRCAFFPVGVNSKGDWYVPSDYVFEHLESLDAAKRLMDLVKKYKPIYIATEKGVLDRVMRPILTQEMRSRRAFVSFREVTRQSGKHIVAAPLQARLQARTIYFPNDRRTRDNVIPQFLDFIPEADNKVDDAIDALANMAQTMSSITRPTEEAPPPELTDEEEEEARWEKLMSGSQRKTSVPFTRFNGLPYK